LAALEILEDALLFEVLESLRYDAYGDGVYQAQEGDKDQAGEDKNLPAQGERVPNAQG
jgi:hypothetical protein